jgi:hypothetical protein
MFFLAMYIYIYISDGFQLQRTAVQGNAVRLQQCPGQLAGLDRSTTRLTARFAVKLCR